MKKLNIQNIDNMLAGNSWFATGGGFPQERSFKMFSHILRSHSIFLKSLDEFNDSDILCIGSGVGSIKKTNVDITKNAGKAIHILENLTNTKIKGIISGETGLECIAADTASQIHVPIVDTDMKGGRAAPEPSINMFNLRGKVVTPLVAINTNGDVSVLLKTQNPQNIEVFLRHFANMAEGTFVAWCPRPAKEFKKCLINKTISRSIELGEMLKTKNIKNIVSKLSGKIIFDGTIEEIQEEENKGFLIRKVLIKNKENICHVWIKNENLVAAINNKPIVTCPDLIVLLNKHNGLGLHNSKLKIGLRILVIGLPNHSRWHTKRGHEIFSPKHFSLQFPVVRL